MELHDFVRETLVQIINGVNEAQETVSESAATVVPTGQGVADTTALNRDVEFDVVVSAQEGKATKGGIGIVVGALALGSHGASDAQTASNNRVKFSVPISLPAQRVNRKRENQP